MHQGWYFLSKMNEMEIGSNGFIRPKNVDSYVNPLVAPNFYTKGNMDNISKAIQLIFIVILFSLGMC